MLKSSKIAHSVPIIPAQFCFVLGKLDFIQVSLIFLIGVLGGRLYCHQSSSVFSLLRSVTASLCLLDFDTSMVVRSAGQLFWGTYHSFTSGVFLMV